MLCFDVDLTVMQWAENYLEDIVDIDTGMWHSIG
jgi:hypothetical protein